MKKAEMNKAGEFNMIIKKIIFVGLAGLMLSACEGDKSTTLQDSLTGDNTVSDKDAISNYDLGAEPPVIPFPNDFLFAPNDDAPISDGTLNIPVEDINDFSDPKVAMNRVDGFSTVAPMTTGFNTAIDETSLSGESVRVYPIEKGNGLDKEATAVSAPLVFGVDYIAALSSVDTTNSTLAILPLKPLAPKSSYAVVITNKLKSASGSPFGVSGSYALTRATTELYDLTVPPAIPPSTAEEIINAIKNTTLQPDEGATEAEIIKAGESAAKLETIRVNIVKPTEDAIIAADSTVTSADIILHWTFTTQSTNEVLSTVRAVAGVPVTTVAASTVDLDGPGPLPAGLTPGALATMFEGTIDVPYYLTASATVDDLTALGSFWKALNPAFLGDTEKNLTQFNPLPEATNAALSIPMLITTPNDGVKPYPTVIFQHGITSDRIALLGIADKLASKGFASVAIDMPMHGVNSSSPFYSAGNERTFDLDLVTQDTDGNIIAAEPDGVTDTSGRHYINLTNLLNTRDNVRQSVADLFALRAAIATIDVDGGGADLDVTNVYFLGHSLGAMVGTVFTAFEGPADVKDAVFAFGGSSIAKILDGSASFGPSIAAGLAAKGVVKGTPDYESFLGAAQTVIDSGDPVNHASAAAEGRGILFFEIVGGSSSPSDLVVPNTVPDGNDTTGTVPAPLAGTEPQLLLMGLNHVNSSQSGTNLHLSTKFVAGDHRSILDPTADSAVTAEMQEQAVIFFENDGDVLTVTDSSVLLAP